MGLHLEAFLICLGRGIGETSLGRDAWSKEGCMSFMACLLAQVNNFEKETS